MHIQIALLSLLIIVLIFYVVCGNEHLSSTKYAGLWGGEDWRHPYGMSVTNPHVLDPIQPLKKPKPGTAWTRVYPWTTDYLGEGYFKSGRAGSGGSVANILGFEFGEPRQGWAPSYAWESDYEQKKVERDDRLSRRATPIG